MENEILKAIQELNKRLASIEYVLKSISNNTNRTGTMGTQVYFPTLAGYKRGQEDARSVTGTIGPD